MPNRIAICICSCKRPQGLTRLLKAINLLSLERWPQEDPQIRIIVIDNDKNQSARPVCDTLREELRWPLEYIPESKRGISFARNTALAAAQADSDWICFLDDDESPDEHWLAELLNTQTITGAPIVTGPVHPIFDEPPEKWILRGHFFDPPPHLPGQSLSRAFTGNILITSSILHETGIRFDERLALSGGEDALFSRQLVKQGVSIVWAEKAIVSEFIPPDRANAAWLIKRKFRIGANMSRIAIILSPGIVTKILLLMKAPLWLLIGISTWITGVFSGKHVRIQGRQWMAYARGLIAGMQGHSVDSYRNIDGS